MISQAERSDEKYFQERRNQVDLASSSSCDDGNDGATDAVRFESVLGSTNNNNNNNNNNNKVLLSSNIARLREISKRMKEQQQQKQQQNVRQWDSTDIANHEEQQRQQYFEDEEMGERLHDFINQTSNHQSNENRWQRQIQDAESSQKRPTLILPASRTLSTSIHTSASGSVNVDLVKDEEEDINDDDQLFITNKVQQEEQLEETSSFDCSFNIPASSNQLQLSSSSTMTMSRSSKISTQNSHEENNMPGNKANCLSNNEHKVTTRTNYDIIRERDSHKDDDDDDDASLDERGRKKAKTKSRGGELLQKGIGVAVTAASITKSKVSSGIQQQIKGSKNIFSSQQFKKSKQKNPSDSSADTTTQTSSSSEQGGGGGGGGGGRGGKKKQLLTSNHKRHDGNDSSCDKRQQQRKKTILWTIVVMVGSTITICLFVFIGRLANSSRKEFYQKKQMMRGFINGVDSTRIKSSSLFLSSDGQTGAATTASVTSSTYSKTVNSLESYDESYESFNKNRYGLSAGVSTNDAGNNNQQQPSSRPRPVIISVIDFKDDDTDTTTESTSNEGVGKEESSVNDNNDKNIKDDEPFSLSDETNSPGGSSSVLSGDEYYYYYYYDDYYYNDNNNDISGTDTDSAFGSKGNSENDNGINDNADNSSISDDGSTETNKEGIDKNGNDSSNGSKGMKKIVKPVTYKPGYLIESTNNPGLMVSMGMECDVIAQTGQPVQLYDPDGGGTDEGDGVVMMYVNSTDTFHEAPDASGVFWDPSPNNIGGWIYVNNAEAANGKGGVGALTFNSDGEIIKYNNLIPRGYTAKNCGGGSTPWNTWISCEEHKSLLPLYPNKGQCWQIDPTGERPIELTVLGQDGDYDDKKGGGNFESVAVDYRDKTIPKFYLTEDDNFGALRRYAPSPDTIKEANTLNNPWILLHRPNGEFHYLIFQDVEIYDENNLPPPSAKSGNDARDSYLVSRGTFAWTTNKERGKQHAKRHFPYTEGIEVIDNTLYFVSKKYKLLYTLNLDTKEFIATSTVRGSLFDGQPDQIKTIMGSHSGILYTYFTEDPDSDKMKIPTGIHGRDQYHRTFTILEGTSDKYKGIETTGLGFSPNYKFLYVAFQKLGTLYQCYRQDGYNFVGRVVDTRYHHSLVQEEL